ncbi:MAG: HAMP domain-containing histidine kinase [Candidatus Kapabacteria bacterium]|nr:HAMP domain-containing histidine kinase [Candidatus Kapabacteria bacterium]
MASPRPLRPAVDRVRIFRASVTKWQIKVLLTLLGLGIIATVLLYTKAIVDELIANEKRTVELYAKQLTSLQEASTDSELLYYIEVTVASIYFPVIITGPDEKPVFPYQQLSLNIDIDSSQTKEEQRAMMIGIMDEMREAYPPYEIKDPDGKVIQKVFFNNSEIVRRLRYMPYIEILIVTAFILIGYVAFSTIRRNEESNIWVGMAKEAAHQLGTPLSSLLAWLDILRMSSDDPPSVLQTAGEMQRDVERLNVIANRFSKIGSQPILTDVSLTDLVEQVCLYFETRLPNLGKRIQLTRELDGQVRAKVNTDLFQWVLENLIRNAVDAMDRQDGHIHIVVAKRGRGGVMLTVTDNGKGMTSAVRSRVFQPGFTTKRRGWGLGLSLSKRIVEEYHAGRIYVKETQPGVGTTFAVELP